VDLTDLIRARLDGLGAYSPGRDSPDGVASAKLSSNEAPLGASFAVRAAVATAAASVHRYPDQSHAVAALADHLGVSSTSLVLTNGSDELCQLIAVLLLGPDRIAVLGDPCYQIDANASLQAGATLRRVPLRHGAHDLEAMADAAQGASVVWLPTPHNPTGVAATPEQLEELIRRVPDDCLVVVDEAYRAFCEPRLHPDALRLLATYPNVIFQRTLSKDWALAGLRVGYGMASPELAGALRRLRAPFSVNGVALGVVEAALRSRGWQAMTVHRVIEQRGVLVAELDRLGIEHFDSQANFVTARLDPERIAATLKEHGLVIRDGADLGLPGWVRISVGWAPPMAQLRAVLGAHALPAPTRAHPTPPRAESTMTRAESTMTSAESTMTRAESTMTSAEEGR